MITKRAATAAAFLLSLVPSLANADSADLERARTATESEDWPLALKYLESAREASPLDKDVLYLLGAVHARMPGHEIPALIYLRASVDPKKPASPVLEKSFRDLEVAIGKRPGALLEQALEVVAVLPAGDRDRVIPAIVKAAARARRDDLARKAAGLSERAPGVTEAAIEVAIEHIAEGRIADAGKAFDLAAEMTDYEVWFHLPRAVPALPRPPAPADPVERQAWKEKYDEIERQANERDARAALADDRGSSGALAKMYLGIIETTNGFGARGFRHWKVGQGIYFGTYGGGFPSQEPAHLARWLGGARLTCFGPCDVKNGTKPQESGKDRTSATSPPKIPWKTVATGGGPVKPDDRDLADLKETIDRHSTNSDAAAGAILLADLAGRIAGASWFLEKNAP